MNEYIETRPVIDGVLLIEATWLRSVLDEQGYTDSFWFWECPSCQCAFGPLVNRAGAEIGAREHAEEDHSR